MTQKGGYEGKKILAAFQTVKLDKKDSDCGSKETLKIFLTEDNAKFFTHRYIKKGNSLVCLTPDVIKDYYDTYINLRSPMYCKSECICNKCAGEGYYKLGIENVGMTVNKISSISLNTALKSFHDQTIHTRVIDWKEYIE